MNQRNVREAKELRGLIQPKEEIGNLYQSQGAARHPWRLNCGRSIVTMIYALILK